MFFSTVGKKNVDADDNVNTPPPQPHATAGTTTTTTLAGACGHTRTAACHLRQAAERAEQLHEEEVHRVRTLPGGDSDSDSHDGTSPRGACATPGENGQCNENEHVVWSYQATLALTRRSALFPLCQVYVQLHEFSHLLFFASSSSSALVDLSDAGNDPAPPSLAGVLWELLLSIDSQAVLRIRRAWSDECLTRQSLRRDVSPAATMPAGNAREDEAPPLLWLLTTGSVLLSVSPDIAHSGTASPASTALLQLLEAVREEGPAGVPALLDLAYVALTQTPMRPLTADELTKRFSSMANDVLRHRLALLLDLWQVRLPLLLQFMDKAAGMKGGGGSGQTRAQRHREVQVAHAVLSLVEGFTITQSTYALFTGTTAPGSDTVTGLMSLLPTLNPVNLQGNSWAQLTNLLHKNNTDNYKLEYVLDTFANALADVAGTVGHPASGSAATLTATPDAELPSLSEALFSLHIVGHKQLHAQRDYVLAFEEIQSTLHKAIELIRVRHVEDGAYLAQTTPYGGVDGTQQQPAAATFTAEGEALLAYLTEQSLLKVNAYLLQKIMKERAPLLLKVLREQHEWYVTGRRPRHWHRNDPTTASSGGGDFSKTVYSACYQPDKGPDGMVEGAANKYIASKVQECFQHQFFIMAACNENIAQCLDKRALVYRCLYSELLVRRRHAAGSGDNNSAANLIEGYHLNEGINPLMSSEGLCTPRQVLQWWQQRTAARLAEEQARQGWVRPLSPPRQQQQPKAAARTEGTKEVHGASATGLIVDTYMVNDRHKQLYETPEHTNNK